MHVVRPDENEGAFAQGLLVVVGDVIHPSFRDKEEFEEIVIMLGRRVDYRTEEAAAAPNLSVDEIVAQQLELAVMHIHNINIAQ
jgi:hypothetical protein